MARSGSRVGSHRPWFAAEPSSPSPAPSIWRRPSSGRWARRRGAKTHPATRSFQALRIAVNAELSELEAGLDAAEQVLAVGGRLAVVTFHSLEDRIVKAFFTERAGRLAGGSRHLPPTVASQAPTFELLFNGARTASDAEMKANPRSRSAMLRAGVRTEAPVWKAAA